MDQLGHTEIENFDVPSFGNEGIGGFDITMDNALRMCGIQSIGNLQS